MVTELRPPVRLIGNRTAIEPAVVPQRRVVEWTGLAQCATKRSTPNRRREARHIRMDGRTTAGQTPTGIRNDDPADV